VYTPYNARTSHSYDVWDVWAGAGRFPSNNTLKTPQNGLQRLWSLNYYLTQCPNSTPQNAQRTTSPQFVNKNPAAASWFTSMKGQRHGLNLLLRSTSLFKFKGCRFILFCGGGSGGTYTSSLTELNSTHVAEELTSNWVQYLSSRRRETSRILRT